MDSHPYCGLVYHRAPSCSQGAGGDEGTKDCGEEGEADGEQNAGGAADAETLKDKNEKRDQPGISVSLSLKTLMKQCLEKDVQTGGRKGHDSLEDAVAARDLVHWQITQPKHC